MVSPDHDAAVGREFRGGKPFGVEAAVGSVGHDQRQTFVQESQGLFMALLNGKTEFLSEVFNRPAYNTEVLKACFLKEAVRLPGAE